MIQLLQQNIFQWHGMVVDCSQEMYWGYVWLAMQWEKPLLGGAKWFPKLQRKNLLKNSFCEISTLYSSSIL